ncbi:MAG: ABC transporter permease, partial [Syntrophomonadaceae bacterium]|nr:ABC transporter permease [Syntrophomonadaceae bacterium]
MGVLGRRLRRTIRSTLGQFLAVAAVIMVGITVYVSVTSVANNMERSKALFYRQYAFADHFFHVIKAPEGVVRQVQQVPGVAAATGRIQKDIPIVRAGGERATARLTSYPLPMDKEVNRLKLLSGRMFEKYPAGGDAEVLVDPQYWKFHHLRPGDTQTLVAEGRQVTVTVVGSATSPEFIYPMQDPSTLYPDPAVFGVFMAPHNQVQQMLNLSGQVNQVVVRFSPGADAEAVVARVKRLLEPYGLLAEYPRKWQLSDAILSGELSQLRVMANFLPAIFLGIAALIEFVMLGRMVRSQRVPIGTMKALGYPNLVIMWYYATYAMVVGLVGALAALGPGIALASYFSGIYATFFNLPEVVGGVNLQAMVTGLCLSVGTGALAGFTASRGVVAIQPAESMQQEPPRQVGRVFLERWPWAWGRLDISWKMTLRAVNRNRFRTAVTWLGIVVATGLLVVSFFFRDTMNYMLEHYFRQDYDYQVRFSRPISEAELPTLAAVDGITRVEPMLEVPVKLTLNGRSQDELLVGMAPGSRLQQLYDASGRPLPVPRDGLLLSQSTARKLGARAGDRLQVETLLGIGPPRRTELTVVATHEQFVGGVSYLSLENANRVLQESHAVSGALLRVRPQQAHAVERALGEMTGVSSVIGREKALSGLTGQMGYMYAFIAIFAGFACVLGFAIVYNAGVITFAERRRELAALRVMGYRLREVTGLLSRETVLQGILGIAAGLPFGWWLAHAYIDAMMASEQYGAYTFEIVIYPLTYLLASMGAVVFTVAAFRLSVRQLRTLDLVE